MPLKSLRAYGYLLFACIGLFVIIGIVLSFLIPPFQIPDENVHWSAGYSRSEALFSTLRGSQESCHYAYDLPNHFDLGRMAFKRGEQMERQEHARINTLKKECNPPPLSYGTVLTYPGVTLARILVRHENAKPANTAILYYLSRIFSGFLVAFALLRVTQLLLKLGYAPGLLTVAVFCLSPLLVQQSFGISADGITFALSLYLVAMLYTARLFRPVDFLALGFLAIATASTKPPLLPLVLISIPACLYLSRGARREMSWLGVIWVVTLAVGVWETSLNHAAPAHQVMGRDLDLGRQLSFVLAHPISSIGLIFQTLQKSLTLELLAGPLGWLDTKVSQNTIFWWSTLLLVSCLVDLLMSFLTKPSLPIFERRGALLSVSIVLLTAIATACLVVLTLYLTWNTVGSDTIIGVQSRYFIPCILVAIPSCFGLIGCLSYKVAPHLSFKFDFQAARLILLLIPVFLIAGLQLIAWSALDLFTRYW